METAEHARNAHAAQAAEFTRLEQARANRGIDHLVQQSLLLQHRPRPGAPNSTLPNLPVEVCDIIPCAGSKLNNKSYA